MDISTLTILLDLITFTVCIVTLEAFSWIFTVCTHCLWVIRHNREYDRRKNLSYRTIFLFSIVSGLFSFIAWVFFIYVVVHSMISVHVFLPILLIMFQVITIHTWYLISSAINIPIEFLPFFSKKIIKVLCKVLKDCKCIPYTALNSWGSVFDNKSKHSLIMNFIDIVPDMLWVKDNENRFVYVNSSLCKDLLLMEEKDIIGKTSSEIAKMLRKRGEYYTFGELCCDSDEITKSRSMPTLFFEYGIVGGDFMALRVLKSPIYNNSNEIIGTIGIARDVSKHVEIYNKLEKLFKDKKYEEGVSVFFAYKQHFESLMDIKDIDSFERGYR
jgi:PAS domain S-box-containing protein